MGGPLEPKADFLAYGRRSATIRQSVRKEGKTDMKHECAGKVGDGGDHSGQVEVGTRRKQAGLAADGAESAI